MTIQSWTALFAVSISLYAPASARADAGAAARRFDRGLALMEKHDYVAAIGEFEQAYQLDPQNRHLYNLGVAHQSNGDRDKAIGYYRRYLEAEPNGALAAEARWQLGRLEADRAEQARREEVAREERERTLALHADEQARAGAAVVRAELTAARAEAAAARAEAAAARDRAERAEQALRKATPCRAGEPGCDERPSRVDRGIAEDAVAGRAWVMPTALTAPAGTWTFSDFELFVLSATYAVSDRFTVGAGAAVPIGGARYGSLTAKLQLVRSGRVRIAAQGLVTRLLNSETVRADDTAMDEMVTIGSAGGALTLCIDTGCRSHLSGYLGGGITRGDRTSVMLAGGASLVLGMGRRAKVVLEVDRGTGGEVGNGALAWYGLRFTSRSVGVDLGVVTPLDEAGREWVGPGLPVVGFTYRAYGE